MTLALNHPRGPVAWSHALGLEHVVGLLDALRRELGEERYRTAPLLRRLLAVGAPGLE
jgi:3-hydroxybutyryl-CoA dehydrogenase